MQAEPRIVYAADGERVEVFGGVFITANYDGGVTEWHIHAGSLPEPSVIVKPRDHADSRRSKVST